MCGIRGKQVKTRGLPSSEQPHQLAQYLPSPPYPNLETTEKSEWHYKDDNHIMMLNTATINHCARKIESFSSQLFMTQKEFQGCSLVKPRRSLVVPCTAQSITVPLFLEIFQAVSVLWKSDCKVNSSLHPEKRMEQNGLPSYK